LSPQTDIPPTPRDLSPLFDQSTTQGFDTSVANETLKADILNAEKALLNSLDGKQDPKTTPSEPSARPPDETQATQSTLLSQTLQEFSLPLTMIQTAAHEGLDNPEALADPPSEDQRPPIHDLRFHLQATGTLGPGLLERLETYTTALGIAFTDLTKQVSSGTLWIPQLDTYYLCRIVNVLKQSALDLKLEIATPDTQPPEKSTLVIQTQKTPPAAFRLPVFHGPASPQILDTAKFGPFVSSSCVLRSEQVELESSKEYEQAVKHLTQELQFQAYEAQGVALVGVHFELQRLNFLTDYRLLASAQTIIHWGRSGFDGRKDS
jgi:hypothetical protein